jgi:hypothetical protein
LLHEGEVYARLERLQGEVVPVHLGLVRLDRGYVLPGASRIRHMMLMSWGGEETANNNNLDDVKLEMERKRSYQELLAEGVIHNDAREPNILWNEERQRVMIIDFDRATLRTAPKHKRLVELTSEKKQKKRKRSLRRDLGG